MNDEIPLDSTDPWDWFLFSGFLEENPGKYRIRPRMAVAIAYRLASIRAMGRVPVLYSHYSGAFVENSVTGHKCCKGLPFWSTKPAEYFLKGPPSGPKGSCARTQWKWFKTLLALSRKELAGLPEKLSSLAPLYTAPPILVSRRIFLGDFI